MQKNRASIRLLRLAAAAALLTLVLAAACSGGGEKEAPSPINQIPQDDWVVRVDGNEISGAWLRNWAVTQMLHLQRTQMVAKVDECELIREGRDLLSKVVVVALEAERRGLTVSEEDLQKRLSDEMSRFTSTEAWLKGLEDSGLTREQRKEQLRLEALMFLYEKEIVGAEVRAEDATEANVREYYDANREKIFNRPRRVHLRHLMRAAPGEVSEEERAKERTRVEEARKRIAGGESFEEVCKEVSTDATALKGGDVGWVDENVPLEPQFKETILGLEAGEMSGVLEGPHGYHLFQAVEVKAAGIEPFDAVSDEIRERMFRAGLKIRMNRHAMALREQLISAEKIEYRNLVPYTGCTLTPKEGEQAENLKKQAEQQ